MDSASNFLSNLFMISVMFLFLEAASFPRKSDPFRSILFDPLLWVLKPSNLMSPPQPSACSCYLDLEIQTTDLIKFIFSTPIYDKNCSTIYAKRISLGWSPTKT